MDCNEKKIGAIALTYEELKTVSGGVAPLHQLPGIENHELEPKPLDLEIPVFESLRPLGDDRP